MRFLGRSPGLYSLLRLVLFVATVMSVLDSSTVVVSSSVKGHHLANEELESIPEGVLSHKPELGGPNYGVHVCSAGQTKTIGGHQGRRCLTSPMLGD